MANGNTRHTSLKFNDEIPQHNHPLTYMTASRTAILWAMLCWLPLSGQTILTIDLNSKAQVIDGFGAHQGNAQVNQSWWLDLYYGDLGASIYRVDLTPRLKSPWSDFSYYSPWFMGSQTKDPLNLEDPANPNGPENNRVRTYTNAADYSRSFGGRNAPIAVMGPDIETNIQYFQYTADGAIEEGKKRQEELGDFKLTGSVWSPLPWVKISSGNRYNQNWWPGPVQNTPWPFIWGGNFAGGHLDVSGQPLAVFDDSHLGGTGPTSALTQFARSTAAYIKGYQDFHQVSFYAISIQNELNFEQFYNSTTYPLASQYIAALKAVRQEFDQHDDLKAIRIMGPEDLLGGDAYGMWEYGGSSGTIHKNLQYLQQMAADGDALEALDFFCIHGYASDGVNAADANPLLWDYWLNGWQQSPAPGIPANVPGYAYYGKKSWMTETSGEKAPWLWPADPYPGNGAWGLALRIHQALTAGRQSAWIYWTFSEEGDDGQASDFALTTEVLRDQSPKYVAAKHFFKYIRPGALRIDIPHESTHPVKASAYLHEDHQTLTIVLLNGSASDQQVRISLDSNVQTNHTSAFLSQQNDYWQQSSPEFTGHELEMTLPGFSVATIYNDINLSTATRDRKTGSIQLLQNHPNPTFGETQIAFEINQPSEIILTLHDVHGKVLKTLVEEKKPAGFHLVNVDTKSLNPGIYLYSITDGHIKAAKKMVVQNIHK